MNKLSVIVLSNTLDDEIYNMNCECIESLYNSEIWDNDDLSLSVIIMESNNQNHYKYDDRIELIIPDEPFNFNRFLNIGIQNTNSKYIALCNNDIIFGEGWFSEILKVKSHRSDILCFSPIDRDYETMSLDKFPVEKDYYIGWDNKYHFSAWCFVLDRAIFEITGLFDETFNFYSADDDFLMTLRKYSLYNALVTKSHVKHLSQVVTKKENAKKSPRIIDRTNYPLSEKHLKRGLKWLWDDIRFYEAFFKLEAKWGDEKMIRRINRLLVKYPIFRKRFITKTLYSKQGNRILSKLTGI